MFVSINTILHICYELSIFLLFILLARQLFIKYIQPILYETIKTIQEQQINRVNQYELTQNTILRIERTTAQQTKTLLTLEEKIKHWHEELIKDKNEYTNTILKNLDIINKHRKTQTTILHYERLKKEAVPNAIKLAHAEFMQYSKEDGRKMLTELIVNLEKGLSTNE